jgi:hypothetical protein
MNTRKNQLSDVSRNALVKEFNRWAIKLFNIDDLNLKKSGFIAISFCFVLFASPKRTKKATENDYIPFSVGSLIKLLYYCSFNSSSLNITLKNSKLKIQNVT